MTDRTGLTIIMVGGVFTTEDGATVDSRQSMAGDPTCQVVYRSLSRSHLWWETVRSIVHPIVKNAGGGYAIVDGPHQVFDLASDGRIKRVSLADLLAVGSPESHWRFPYDEHLDVETLREGLHVQVLVVGEPPMGLGGPDSKQVGEADPFDATVAGQVEDLVRSVHDGVAATRILDDRMDDGAHRLPPQVRSRQRAVHHLARGVAGHGLTRVHGGAIFRGEDAPDHDDGEARAIGHCGGSPDANRTCRHS